jgi:anti-sigma regulatory factor (Ser/Thr protein kinase)
VHFLWSRGRRISALTIEVEAAPDSAREVRSWLLSLAADHGADEDLRGRIAIAVTEAMTNAVRHAYPPDVRGRIEITADVEEGSWRSSWRTRGAGSSLASAAASGPGWG